MKILITGGAGFIGHHVIDHFLQKTSATITVLDRLDQSGNLNRIIELDSWRRQPNRVRVFYHNLRSEFSSQVMAQLGTYDYILHLAALTHVDRSIECPMEAVQENVVATCNILDYARTVGCGRFLYFSTDEVFGPAPPGVHYKENDRYNSGNPYAAAKAGGEELAIAFHNTYKLPVLVTHTMNVIGERQHPEKFVPMTIKKVRDNEEVLIHADKTCTHAGSRYYIHARRVAKAAAFILESGKEGEKYNIVGEKELDNLQLANIIAKSVGRPLKHKMVDFHSSRPGHDLRYALDGSKLEKMGFRHGSAIEQDIYDLVKWTLENPHWLLDRRIM